MTSCPASIRRRGVFDLAGKAEELAALDERASQPDFWNDSREAKRVLRAADGLREELERLERPHHAAPTTSPSWPSWPTDAGDAELDDGRRGRVRDASRPTTSGCARACSSRGEYDDSDAFISISAGAGGTEATDWAEMLLRMYLRWCERRGFGTEIVDRLEGEETGIKSATVSVQGRRAYGWLRAEAGVHRLVRISPYDSQNRRHTTFVQVEILPEVEAAAEIEDIPDDELKIDTYRAQGAGGQHVNKTDSAVRLTHIPTGIVAQSQNERSQHQNREAAMKILRARLLERRIEEREAEIRELKGEHKDAGWGNQIRSYVLHPYQMVKDHRTEHETGNTTAVLDGDLDAFMVAELERVATEREGGTA